MRSILLTGLVCLFFTACSYIETKLGDYYFWKAKKISSKDEVTQTEIDKFFDYIIKAVEKKRNLPEAVDMVESVTDASIKAGYLKAYDHQFRFYRRYIEVNPYAWNVYLNIINILALKGDLYNLANLASDFDKNRARPEFKMLSFITKVNLLYWLESYGYLSLNEDYETVMDHLERYCMTFRDINEIILLDKQGFFKNADSQLYYYYFGSLNDLMAKEGFVVRNCQIRERVRSNQAYSRILRYLIAGNRYLSKQEYANAIMYYRAALNINDRFLEARKGLLETEFQKALSISLMKKKNEDLIELIKDNMDEVDDMIKEKNKGSGSAVPFLSDDKLLSSLYTLKSAMLSVLYENERNEKKKSTYFKELTLSINEAIKYDPTNRLARDLYDRFVSK